MNERGLRNYRFGDQSMEIKESRLHVKVKSVKVDGVDGEPEED